MLGILAQGTAVDIGIGAGGAVVVAVIGMLVKKGVTGTFSIGGGNGKERSSSSPLRPGIDFVTPLQCERNHQEYRKHQEELQDLRDKQAMERHSETLGAITELRRDVKESLSAIHQRIDGLRA